MRIISNKFREREYRLSSTDGQNIEFSDRLNDGEQGLTWAESSYIKIPKAFGAARNIIPDMQGRNFYVVTDRCLVYVITDSLAGPESYALVGRIG